jgi:hypothetical protein
MLLQIVPQLSYQRSIVLTSNADVPLLLQHLADCLRAVEARDIRVTEDAVYFKGGAFRMVTNWNVLVPFDAGRFTVSDGGQIVMYTMSYRQLLVISALMSGAMALFLFLAHQVSASVFAFPLIWAWLFGANLAIGKNRFDDFVSRSLNSFSQ